METTVRRAWSVMEIIELRKALGKGSTPEEAAAILQRNLDEVRENAVQMGLWGRTISMFGPRKRY